ncbi:hypothetical protein [Niallia sp. Krafla_26]|uniref:hypothetical protein n=1 Tax=Niallia sp. Krafla_26 TaxID=3064703 RepID=UPI003D162B6B
MKKLLEDHEVKKILEGFFFFTSFLGALTVTFAAFDFGRDFFQTYKYGLISSIWLGQIGLFIMDRLEKKQKNESKSFN